MSPRVTFPPLRLALAAALALGCAAKGGAPQEQITQGSAADHAAKPPGRVAPSATGDFVWAGSIADGRSLQVSNINGSINVSPATDGSVHITAEKKGPDSKLGDVRVELREHDGGVSVCTLYPGMTIGNDGRCTGESRDTGDVQVRYVIAIPEGVKFLGRTVNGSVKTDALTGEVDATTVNGSVKIAGAGLARAKAVNGSIDVQLTNADGDAPLSFETVNGSITVALPDAANAELRASTVHGKIRTEFGLPVKTGMGPGSTLQGRLGEGGREIKLATVNGSIRIAKADS